MNNPSTYIEQEEFIANSQEINSTLANINNRLGFVEENLLGFSEVFSMYDTCRFDRSRKPNSPSPWCVAFEEEEILVKKPCSYYQHTVNMLIHTFMIHFTGYGVFC